MKDQKDPSGVSFNDYLEVTITALNCQFLRHGSEDARRRPTASTAVGHFWATGMNRVPFYPPPAPTEARSVVGCEPIPHASDGLDVAFADLLAEVTNVDVDDV